MDFLSRRFIGVCITGVLSGRNEKGMPITAVGTTAQSRVISRAPDALASFPAAKLGTLLGLCNSISTPNLRSNVKNALCELNVALG